MFLELKLVSVSFNCNSLTSLTSLIRTLFSMFFFSNNIVIYSINTVIYSLNIVIYSVNIVMTQYSCTNFISIHLRYFCAKILFKPKTQATRLSCLIFKSCWKTLTNSNESVAHSLRIINQLCACLVRWNRSFSSASGGNRSKP